MSTKTVSRSKKPAKAPAEAAPRLSDQRSFAGARSELEAARSEIRKAMVATIDLWVWGRGGKGAQIETGSETAFAAISALRHADLEIDNIESDLRREPSHV